jgi:hypothetical protein
MARIVVATGFGGPEVLSIVEQELAAPGPDEVRIVVRAAGINPVDWKRYGGMMGTAAPMPMRLGSEAAGVVSEVGAAAIGPAGPIAAGDEVIAFRIEGAYADEIVVPATAVVPKPAAMGWNEAGGLMLAGATAVHALSATNVEGDRHRERGQPRLPARAWRHADHLRSRPGRPACVRSRPAASTPRPTASAATSARRRRRGPSRRTDRPRVRDARARSALRLSRVGAGHLDGFRQICCRYPPRSGQTSSRSPIDRR